MLQNAVRYAIIVIKVAFRVSNYVIWVLQLSCFRGRVCILSGITFAYVSKFNVRVLRSCIIVESCASLNAGGVINLSNLVFYWGLPRAVLQRCGTCHGPSPG